MHSISHRLDEGYILVTLFEILKCINAILFCHGREGGECGFLFSSLSCFYILDAYIINSNWHEKRIS